MNLIVFVGNDGAPAYRVAERLSAGILAQEFSPFILTGLELSVARKSANEPGNSNADAHCHQFPNKAACVAFDELPDGSENLLHGPKLITSQASQKDIKNPQIGIRGFFKVLSTNLYYSSFSIPSISSNKA